MVRSLFPEQAVPINNIATYAEGHVPVDLDEMYHHEGSSLLNKGIGIRMIIFM